MDEGIRWLVLTHEHKERSVDWYWAFGLVVFIGIALSIYFGNILLAIILAVGAISIGLLLLRGPREHEVHIHERGVSVDGTLYPYASLQSFWVATEEPHEDGYFMPRSDLLLTTNGYINPYMTLPLRDDEHAEEVRAYLIRYIQEEEQRPHLAEHLVEMLGL